MNSTRYRLGVDVGGTHTDLVLLDTTTGELSVEKVASTPKNPALGVLEGLGRFIAKGIPPAHIGFFAHGTTITTNALLEMRGAKVGLLITQGYRAVQEIQNQARDGNLFDYFYAKPAAIAPQHLTKEIPERCDYAGRVLRPLDKDAVRRAARELKDASVESIAGGRTVHTLFSGPAAGAQASAYLAREDARRGLVTLDMGGTSADIAFIEGGAPLEVTEGVIARRQVDVPALDMTTISAGGGSIAWIDGGGFLNVGPASAGADPGPACYGRGGLRPTVTDADLVCGYLNPDYFLGGAQKLDVAAARATLKAHVADPLQMDVTAAAAGIQRIVDMRIADEVRVFAAKRGVDLSAFTLLPFGGAGAVHAAAVAEELGMRRILVPPRPGAFSALGLLCTDVVHDYIRSELRTLAGVTADHAEDIFRQLEGTARAELAAEGMNPADARFARELDLRYTGQGYELRTPLEGLFLDRLTAASLQAARERVDERHTHIHAHAAKERPAQLANYRPGVG